MSALSALIWFSSPYTSVDHGMWGDTSVGSPSTGVRLGRPLPRKAGIFISTLVMGKDSLFSKELMYLGEQKPAVKPGDGAGVSSGCSAALLGLSLRHRKEKAKKGARFYEENCII